jgi:trk system potassium uptake protein TrkA
VLESNLRQKYSLNIIALEHNGETSTDITPDRVLNEGDYIVVVGKRDNIKKLESYLTN